MKTMDQIAEAAGVTKSAIYKRFQSYGLSVTSLKGEKQGRATVYGEEVERLIFLMFQPAPGVESKVESLEQSTEAKIKELQRVEAPPAVESLENFQVESKVENKVNAQRAKIEELQGLVENLQVENKAAKLEKDQAEARAERAEAQADALLQQIDKLTDTIRAAEAIQAAQLTRLPAPQRAGLFSRFIDRIRGGQRKE